MLVYGPKRPFLLRYVSRDTRHIDFPRVDGLSTNPRVLGRHKSVLMVVVNRHLIYDVMDKTIYTL